MSNGTGKCNQFYIKHIRLKSLINYKFDYGKKLDPKQHYNIIYMTIPFVSDWKVTWCKKGATKVKVKVTDKQAEQ